jgi:hypothetical protein
MKTFKELLVSICWGIAVGLLAGFFLVVQPVVLSIYDWSPLAALAAWIIGCGLSLYGMYKVVL